MIAFLRRQLRNPRALRLTLACYWLLLFIATHLPRSTPGLPGEGVDKLIHVAAFAVLAVLLAAAWQASAGYLMWRHLVWAWIVLTLYAALDEWTQNFVGRYGSVSDTLADAVGAALGLALFAWLRPRSTVVGNGKR